ncbi:hypothetical protein [Photobacterium kasasachensis]|uniref:hypothetical protein n=1 Tax=Photobacterium kasasachensis TaxID=2910240 RepID=UPI003D0F6847
MIIKGKPVRDMSLKLNTLFRGLGCLLLLLFLVNLHSLTDTLSNSALSLQKLTTAMGPGSKASVVAEAAEPAVAETALADKAPIEEKATTFEDEVVELREAALVRFANKFNFPNSVEFYSLASSENWMFSPVTVKNKDNVLNLTTCGYYAAKNAMGLAREREPFIIDLVYDFLNQRYSVHGYFKDDRANYHQFNGTKKPVELSRNRFKNKWDVACKPLNVEKFDDILSVATLGRFEPDAEMAFKRQLNAFGANVKSEIETCITDETLIASVPKLATRKDLCLANAQCTILDGGVGGKCDVVKKACSSDAASQLCQTTGEAITSKTTDNDQAAS